MVVTVVGQNCCDSGDNSAERSHAKHPDEDIEAVGYAEERQKLGEGGQAAHAKPEVLRDDVAELPEVGLTKDSDTVVVKVRS